MASPGRQQFTGRQPSTGFGDPFSFGRQESDGIAQSPTGRGRGKGSGKNSASTPTHIAFAQTAAPTGPGGYAPLGSGFPGQGYGQSSSPAAPKAPMPTMRQGALYGALEALQVATGQLLKDTDDSAPNILGGGQPLSGRRGGGANQTPEQVWQSIPSGGEAAWKPSNTRASQRLKVARLQEALSEAATGLQKATDAIKGGAEDEVALGAASLGPPGPSSALRQECVVLEAEAKELEEEKAFLDARVSEVKKELARVREALGPSSRSSQARKEVSMEPEASTEQASAKSPSDDVNELAVVLRLLACLKDLALSNRSVILPSDPSRWTREQQVVAYFLDEVEACQTRIDAY